MIVASAIPATCVPWPWFGAVTITPTSGLPAIIDPVIIDGTTQPKYTTAPLIEIRGAVDGLTIPAGWSPVRSLIIVGFKGNGISIGMAGGSMVNRPTSASTAASQQAKTRRIEKRV